MAQTNWWPFCIVKAAFLWYPVVAQLLRCTYVRTYVHSPPGHGVILHHPRKALAGNNNENPIYLRIIVNERCSQRTPKDVGIPKIKSKTLQLSPSRHPAVPPSHQPSATGHGDFTGNVLKHFHLLRLAFLASNIDDYPPESLFFYLLLFVFPSIFRPFPSPRSNFVPFSTFHI